MIYILCSVLWLEERRGQVQPCFDVAGLWAARIDKPDKGQSSAKSPETAVFRQENFNSTAELIDEFLKFCGDEFMLCLWDGFSAGRMKKILDTVGRRHPYVHMYHLQQIYELSMEKCYDIKKRRSMQDRLDKKPIRKNPSAVENELKWMISVFGSMNFSLVEKKPSVDFLHQPSNRYFIYGNGKCFHTNKCSIIRDAPLSSLRAFTYYSSAFDSGYTPCMKCKPKNEDEQTAELMRRVNEEKQKEAKAGRTVGQKTAKKHKKKLTVYRSLSHMCGMYGLNFRKSGKYAYISDDTESYRISPEEKTVILFVKSGDEYVSTDKVFADPYEAVRSIAHKQNAVKK